MGFARSPRDFFGPWLLAPFDRPGSLKSRVPPLGLTHSLPLHASHLTGTVSGMRELCVERPLSTVNKMADQRNFFIISASCTGTGLFSAWDSSTILLSSDWLVTTKKFRLHCYVFLASLTLVSQDSLAWTVYMVKGYPTQPGALVGGLPCLACKRFNMFSKEMYEKLALPG